MIHTVLECVGLTFLSLASLAIVWGVNRAAPAAPDRTAERQQMRHDRRKS